MINQAPAEARAESVDIKEYLAVLLKRKWLVLVCFLLSMAGTTAFLFTRQPIYRANAKMLVTVAGGILPTAEVTADGAGFYATQIDIMLSQTMLKRVNVKEDLREIFEENFTVSDKIDLILKMMESGVALRFSELFANAASRTEIVVTFLALLELIRLKQLRAQQGEEFGEIELVKA